MITQLRVENFKALKDVTLNLTPIHVLIGPNDSGKTSILEAIRIAVTCFQPLLPSLYTNLGVVQGVLPSGHLLHGGKPDGEIRFRTIANKIPDNSNEERSTTLTFKQGTLTDCVTQPDYTHGMALAWFANQVQIAKWDPRQLKLAAATDRNCQFEIDVNGFGLPRCLDDIIGMDSKSFDVIRRKMKEFFPELEDLQLRPSAARRIARKPGHPIDTVIAADGKQIYFKFNATDYLPAENVSDGIVIVLAYLTLLHCPSQIAGMSVLLIEEPENGLHPARLKDVVNILRELLQSQSPRSNQVIFTTHSPYVLDLFEPQEVTLCRKGPDGAVQVRRLSENPLVSRLSDIFSLGEIWSGEGDEALFESDATVDQVEVTGP